MSSTNRLSSDYAPAAVPARELEVGTDVPALERSVSRVQSTVYCASIRFAHQVHFDDDLCRAQGWKGVILPGFLMGNWCLEAVTRMLGPQSVVRAMSFRLTSVAYPDTLMRTSGAVTAVEHEAGCTVVTCAMKVVDPDGTTVTKATVTVAVPDLD